MEVEEKVVKGGGVVQGGELASGGGRSEAAGGCFIIHRILISSF